MSDEQSPSVRRAFLVAVKFLYYEMVSVIALSALFWLVSIPVLTLGGSLLALFETVSAIYSGSGPRQEVPRIRYFLRAARRNIKRGLPLTAGLLFVPFNTYWYFQIGLSSQHDQMYLLGGIAGLYLFLIVVVFVLRTANVATRTGSELREAVELAARSFARRPYFAIFHTSAAVLAMLGGLFFLIALLFVVPASLALFEIVSYEEMTGGNPGVALKRYATPN